MQVPPTQRPTYPCNGDPFPSGFGDDSTASSEMASTGLDEGFKTRAQKIPNST